jgi:hypothetical protein
MPAKRKQSQQDSKIHWKKVGCFDAFNVRDFVLSKQSDIRDSDQKKPQAPLPRKRKMKNGRATSWRRKPKKPKFVKCEELPEPEVGIHVRLGTPSSISMQAANIDSHWPGRTL